MRFQETKRRKVNGKMGKRTKKGREKLHSKSVEEEIERKEKHQTPKIPIV